MRATRGFRPLRVWCVNDMGARGAFVLECGIFFARSQIDRDDATPGKKSSAKSSAKFFWWFSWHEGAVAVRLPKFHVDFHVDFFYFAQAHRKNTFRTSNGPIQVPRHASFRGTSFEPLRGTSLIHFEEPALGHFEEPYLSHFEEPDVSHFEEPVLIHFEEPWVTISRSHR